MSYLDPDALKLIEDFETFVPYVYDDAHAPVKCEDGKHRYREWLGEGVAGTLTIGFGHTSSAGGPKVVQGMRWTREQADRNLESDLGRVIADVRRMVEVELNPHQFGALTSFHYNCGKLGGSNVLKRVNAQRFDDVPAAMMAYTHTHINGELVESRGLARRRRAECALWRSSIKEIVPLGEDEQKAPEVVVDPEPPKGMAASKTGNASIVVGGAAGTEVLTQAKDALDKANEIHETVKDFGLIELLQKVMSDPRLIVALVVVGCAMFIWWDRRKKLLEEHV